MASPLVAGLTALVLAQNLTLSPAELHEFVPKIATKNVLSRMPRNTVNLLAYNQF
jgi:hypothetical protein